MTEREEVIKIMGEQDFQALETENHFEELFDFFSSSGEMPYGTMKARTGDPWQWIDARVEMLRDRKSFADLPLLMLEMADEPVI
jgi:hypothetical protein